ncbi:MAG: thioesterase domain-containing protein [Chloroflexota bacterium]
MSLEIGPGQRANLTRMCAEAGAKHIYAVEIDELAYQEARALLEELGLTEIVTLIHGDVTQINLPELVDVCVSSLGGQIGGSEGIGVINNQAQRFLKPDGVMLPQRYVSKIAAVTLPDETVGNPQFTSLGQYYAHQIFEQIGYSFELRVILNHFDPASIISDAAVFEDLDTSHMPIPTAYEHQIRLKITRSQVRLDGFVVWLNLHLQAGVEIDVLGKNASWLPVYFPVFYPGIMVSEGDIIEATCIGTLCDNQINPDYRLKGRVIQPNGHKIEFDHLSYHHQRHYPQSAFYKDLLSQLPQDDRNVSILDQTTDLDTHIISSQGRLETQLIEVWEQLLGVQSIGVNDNFFELGGHSLLAIRLFTQIENQFQKKLPMSTLFEAPSIKQLADLIRDEANSVTETALVPIQTQGSAPPFFCIHALGGRVLSYRTLAQSLGNEQPVYGLQWVNHTTVVDMAAHYITEIQTFQPQGPYYLGGLSMGGMIAFEMAQQLVAQNQEVALLAFFDTYGPEYPKDMPRQERYKDYIGRLVQGDGISFALRLVKGWAPGLKHWSFCTICVSLRFVTPV